jgi:hypothetical protein
MISWRITFPLVLIVVSSSAACRSDVELPRVWPPESAGDITPGCETLTLGEARFIGAVAPVVRQLMYLKFGVSFFRDPHGIGTPTFLRIGTRQIRVKEATPETLAAAGWPELPFVSAPRRIFGVRLHEGSDAGVDFAFIGTEAEYLSLRCYPGDTCDFAIGWEGHPMVSFPAHESALKAALPSHAIVGPCRPAF